MAVIAKIILDRRRPRRNNTCPIYLRIWFKRTNINISLGYTISEDDWDDTNERVLKSCTLVSNITRLNNYLAKQKTNAYDVITQLQDKGELSSLSVSELKERIINKNKSISVSDYTEDVIQGMKVSRKFGNAAAYQNCLNAIKSFQNEVDLDFDQINYKYLTRFETYFLAQGNSINGLSFLMRTLRAIYNRAIKEGYASRDLYPFGSYKIKKEPTRKRAIRIEDLDKIRDKSFPEGSDPWNTRNYYLASFYLMGISFIDMARLKVENITNGRIEYRRHKTGKLHSIKISPRLQGILDHYLVDKEKSDFIFPIIKRSDNAELEFKDIRNQNKIYNKKLKDLASACKVDAHLTSYTSRHSWATIAKRKGIPTAIISEGLGHTSEHTTQVYLDSFDKEVMDEYNESIIS